jgi:hypothetical protein
VFYRQYIRSHRRINHDHLCTAQVRASTRYVTCHLPPKARTSTPPLSPPLKMVSNPYEPLSNGGQPLPIHSTPKSRRWLILIIVTTILIGLGLVGDMLSPEPYTPRIAKHLGVELPFSVSECGNNICIS